MSGDLEPEDKVTDAVTSHKVLDCIMPYIFALMSIFKALIFVLY